MQRNCANCGAQGPEPAKYCGQCGHPLGDNPATGGRAAHPTPVPPPDGFEQCPDAPSLFVKTESSYGGQRLLGTEGINLHVWNAGYSLVDVRLRVEGIDETARAFKWTADAIKRIPRGQAVTVEVPSWVFENPVEQISIKLESADYE